jgi:3-oxoacyl-[acyl-carrier protein] reductase
MLKNRIAPVTGASRGIGAATARTLAKHGAAVAVNYRNSAAEAQQLVDDITGAGGCGMAVQADVCLEGDVERMVKLVGERLGPVDTLVLNAYIGVPFQPLTQTCWDDLNAKVTGELKAAFYPVQALAPEMAARNGGCIIAISSNVAQHPVPGMGAYCVGKSTLEALMRALALELGPSGIRVNTVAAGLTMSGDGAQSPDQLKQLVAAATPLRRYAQPEDIAAAVLMLAQDEASFATGNVLTVDGGLRLGLL